MLLQGKKAIITGGTRGIGFSVAEVFLKNGASVALFGSRQETVDKALAQLKSENPAWEVIGMAPDLTDYAALDAAFSEVENRFGRIDILVNNAGISAREPLYEYTPEAFQRIMDLNVTAVFNGCRAAAIRMKAQGGGSIINTSSMVSLYGQPSGVGYPTSKFAVNGMTRSLARELGRDNIRVNAVAPGVTRTDMVANLPEEIVRRVCAPIPLGRMAEPEDTACEAVIEAVKAAGYTKVLLRPLMVVAGDHANNDMAGADEDSWLSQFNAAGCFDSVNTQIAGLGEIDAVQALYVAHTKAAIDTLNG